MLGFISASDRGASDKVLLGVANRLLAMNFDVTGVVQINTEVDPDRPCLMDLRVLSNGVHIRISQSLGPMSSGCRLDPAGLEQAVALVEASLHQGNPRLLIVNKFGKHEVEGRGFRPVIGTALSMGVPVLAAVSPKNRDAFHAFADGFSHLLPSDEESILTWCQTVKMT